MIQIYVSINLYIYLNIFNFIRVYICMFFKLVVKIDESRMLGIQLGESRGGVVLSTSVNVPHFTK